MRVGFWTPDPGSLSAPERCFRWTAEALADHEAVDLVVGSPKECDWDVVTTEAATPRALAVAHDTDVIHWNKMMDYTLPKTVPAKRVLTYHGDAQWIAPQLNYGTHPYLKSVKEIVVEACKIWQYDAVCFVSENARLRMEQRFGRILSQTDTIYNGVPPHIEQTESTNDEQPYVFHVSQYGPRKNPEGLLEGYRRADVEMPLYIAGSGWNVDDPAVTTVGYVDDAEISRWYSGASALLFPSLHEAFGLPVVEAIECGTTPVVSDRYALPEIAGNHGVVCDPDDYDDIARAIERAIECDDPTESTQFSWNRTANKLVDMYKSL